MPQDTTGADSRAPAPVGRVAVRATRRSRGLERWQAEELLLDRAHDLRAELEVVQVDVLLGRVLDSVVPLDLVARQVVDRVDDRRGGLRGRETEELRLLDVE